MHYIVLDLEWNQPISRKSHPYVDIGDRLTCEIIQIGAVKLDSNLKMVDRFQAVVRPKYYTKLNAKVMKLVSLELEEIRSGERFPDAIGQFRQWCGEDFVMFSWGRDDMYVLMQNLDFYGQDMSWLHRWYDLQMMYGLSVHGSVDQRSLQSALEYYQIPYEDTLFHDALNDAIYTACVMRCFDLKAGVESYIYPPSFRHFCEECNALLYGHFENWRQVMENRAVCALPCPYCEREMETEVSWFKQNSRLFCAAHCSEHGSFIVKVKPNKKDEGIFCINKIFRRADTGQIEALKRRQQMVDREEKRKRKRNRNKAAVHA